MHQDGQYWAIRIYVLAKQLNLPTKTLVGMAHRLGIKINGLSLLDGAERAAIEKAAKDRPHDEE
jgi:hypothetical protein